MPYSRGGRSLLEYIREEGSCLDSRTKRAMSYVIATLHGEALPRPFRIFPRALSRSFLRSVYVYLYIYIYIYIYIYRYTLVRRLRLKRSITRGTSSLGVAAARSTVLSLFPPVVCMSPTTPPLPSLLPGSFPCVVLAPSLAYPPRFPFTLRPGRWSFYRCEKSSCHTIILSGT